MPQQSQRQSQTVKTQGKPLHLGGKGSAGWGGRGGGGGKGGGGGRGGGEDGV